MSSFAQRCRYNLCLDDLGEWVVGRWVAVTVCSLSVSVGRAAGRDAWAGRPMGRQAGAGLCSEEGKRAHARRGCRSAPAWTTHSRRPSLQPTQAVRFFLLRASAEREGCWVANAALWEPCRPINTLVDSVVPRSAAMWSQPRGKTPSAGWPGSDKLNLLVGCMRTVCSRQRPRPKKLFLKSGR